MELLITVLCAAVQFSHGIIIQRNLDVVYQWGELHFQTPPGYPVGSEQTNTAFITGLEITTDRIFMGLGRLKNGVAATLGYTYRTYTTTPTSPSLQAYPNWDWHAPAASRNITNCNATLISVFRMARDKCNRLWVIDSGVIDLGGSYSAPCPPKIVIFNLATDQVVRIIPFPSDVLTALSLTTNIVLDDYNTMTKTFVGCDSVFAYISDTRSPGLIVYDSARNRFWRIEHPYTYPDPHYGILTIENVTFTLMDGIVGLALSGFGHKRCLYNHPFAGVETFCFPTHAIQKPNTGDPSRLPFYEAVNRSSQAFGFTADTLDGTIFYNQVTRNTIVSWNPYTNMKRTLAYSPEIVKPASDIKQDNRYRNIIWFATLELQKYITGTVDSSNEKNLQVVTLKF